MAEILSDVYMPDRIYLNDEGGFRWIFWNECHDDGEKYNGIAGCFEIHDIYAEDVVKCFEEVGVEDFFGEILGYVWAFKQSSWCDASDELLPVFTETLREYVFSEGWVFYKGEDLDAVVPILYARAKEYLRNN